MSDKFIGMALSVLLGPFIILLFLVSKDATDIQDAEPSYKSQTASEQGSG